MKSFLLVLLALFSQQALAVNEIPSPKYTRSVHDRYNIYDELKDKLAKEHTAFTSDAKYTSLTFKCFKKYTTWFVNYLSPIYEKSINTNRKIPKESFDCDDFAFLYKSLWSASSLKADTKTMGLAVGVIIVDNIKSYFDVPMGGKHALNIVHTSRGWYVVEPKNGKYCSIDDYHNPIECYIF